MKCQISDVVYLIKCLQIFNKVYLTQCYVFGFKINRGTKNSDIKLLILTNCDPVTVNIILILILVKNENIKNNKINVKKIHIKNMYN